MRATSGRRCGPRTSNATTMMSTNSGNPTPNIATSLMSRDGSISDLLYTVECVRGGTALQSCNHIKVVIETGNVRDSEVLSLQNEQGMMEIQARRCSSHRHSESSKALPPSATM